ncbi:retrovirus-related pol polyprotein from transposon TNT 1-94, partial [Tanacetum coccineum]
YNDSMLSDKCVNAHVTSKSVMKKSKRKVWKPTGKVFTKTGYIWRPTGQTFTIVGNACPLTRFTTTTENPHRKLITLEAKIHKHAVTLVYSRKLRKTKSTDPVSKPKIIKFANIKEPSKSWGSTVSNVPSSSLNDCRVYYVEGLGHNLFSVGQFCDSDLEVAFPQHTCFIRNLEGVDLLTGSQGDNLYILSLGDKMVSSPICLLSKATKTKSWLWHQRLSHLNFGAINHLARHGLVRGLPKLKFEKEHITDNGTEFVNQTLREYHEKVGISHETYVARSPQQNGVVERCNHTLTEVARTMLIYVKALLFLWAEAVATASPEVITLIVELVAPEPAGSTGSPSSTTVDQDTPSASNSQSITETQSPVISNDVEEYGHDLDVAHMNNDPFFGILITDYNSEASSSLDVIPTVVYTATPYSEHVNKWTKDHPLENIIGELQRPVSTRLQLHEQALFCYYDAFLTSVEPKNYKDALTQACWIEAMQEELNEFEHLEVWELVPHPDKVMVITLKWIYKVKLDELRGILNNKA